MAPTPPTTAQVWTDADAVFESISHHETLIFSRQERTIRRRIGPAGSASSSHAWQSQVLDDAAFEELDGFLSGLELIRIENELPPPPGGPAQITIAGSSGRLRLGWRGNTGGDYYCLQPQELKALFELLHRLGPS